MTWARSILVGILAVGVVGPASAHDGAMFGVSPFVRDGELSGGGMDWGLALLEDGVPLWTCSEATGASTFWWYRQLDGTVLVGTDAGIHSSDDGGCTWSPATGVLAGRSVYSHRVDPTDHETLLVTTDAPGLVVRSDDGGETWTTLLEDPERAVWRTALRPGAQEMVALAVDAQGVASLLRSTDGGASWPAELLLEGIGAPSLFDYSDDGEVLYLGGVGESSFVVVSVPSDLSAPPTLLFEPDLYVSGFEDFGGTFHVLSNFEVHQTWDGTGEPVSDDAPADACLFELDGVLWSCAGGAAAAQFNRSDDGVVWESFFFHDEVVPRECPAGTAAAEVCPAVWEQYWGGPGVDPGDDDDSTDPDDDCEGCAVGPGGTSAVGLLLGLVAARIRRRTPAR